jgi:transcriptional regulator with XRE-family HTH domain
VLKPSKRNYKEIQTPWYLTHQKIIILWMNQSRESKPPLSLRLIFARNVRLVRAHASLSQEAMADLAGLDRAFVGTLERGTRNISIDNIERIAKALGEEPYELMRPDLPAARGLSLELVRSPRTTRLYPAQRKPRKAKEK